jgi:paraquat-inducible protein B
LSEKLKLGLPPLVDSLTATSDRTDKLAAEAIGTLQDVRSRMDVTLANIDRLAVTGDRQLNARGADLQKLLVAAAQTATRANAALESVRGLTAERGAARANIDSALRDIAAASASLRGFASDVEHNPQLLLTGRKP